MRPTRQMWQGMALMYAITFTILLFWASQTAFREGIQVRNTMGAVVCALLWFLVAWARWAKRWERWDVLVTMLILGSIWGVMFWAP